MTSHTDTDAETDTETTTDAETDAEATTDAETDAEATTDVEMDGGTRVDPGADGETDTGTDTRIGTLTDLGRSGPDYGALVAFLRERYGGDLRWVASLDADTYRYKVRYIREDLKTELTTHQLDAVIHRSIAMFDRPRVEKVYSHLGDAQSLVVQHERATAVHLYLDGSRGVVVKIRAGNDISLPGFVEECLAALYGDGR
jgi:hypothetical protein